MVLPRRGQWIVVIAQELRPAVRRHQLNRPARDSTKSTAEKAKRGGARRSGCSSVSAGGLLCQSVTGIGRKVEEVGSSPDVPST